MSREEQNKWNAVYREGRLRSHFSGSRSVVVDWAEPMLPSRARILDLGCGVLRNSQGLAEKGHHVLAVDVARQAFHRARPWPQTLQPLVADLDHWSIPVRAFDLIIMIHYLNRNLVASLISALRPQGFLALEIRSPLPEEEKEPLPRYWLRLDEIPVLFPSLAVMELRPPAPQSKSVKALLRLS